MEKQYSLALWGWAARWIAHIGVIKFIEENKLKINEINI
jgi:predicted acylesterase/phospholipase RssA